MAYEARKSGSRFYYASLRDAATGRVRKVYLGRGERAAEAAAAVAGRRERREAERRAVRDARAALRALDGLTAELDAAAALLMEAVLLAWGWHRPNYGPWRRRRHGHGSDGAAPRVGGAG